MGPQGQRPERCSHEPRNADSYQKLEEARNGFSPGVWRERSPANTLTVDFWPPRTVRA